MAEWMRKLDPYSRRALQTSAPEEGMDVTVRLRDRDQSAAKDELAQSGLEVQSTLGDLVVGHVADRETLIRVAELPCVAEVQASRPLHSENQ